MNATKFNKDGVTVWTNNSFVSSAILNTNESFDFNTGFIREEKHIMWVKGNDEATVTKQVDSLIKAINSGKLATYRAFSETPFYVGQEEDVNPSSGELLGRYSQVRMCPADQYDTLNRVYVVNKAITASTPISAEA